MSRYYADDEKIGAAINLSLGMQRMWKYKQIIYILHFLQRSFLLMMAMWTIRINLKSLNSRHKLK